MSYQKLCDLFARFEHVHYSSCRFSRTTKLILLVACHQVIDPEAA